MNELLAEIMRRVEERWGEGAYEGPYSRQEIVEGVREILDELRGDAARIVDRAVDLVMASGAVEGRVALLQGAEIEFSGTFYPGAYERLDGAIRALPDYCNICENFPCLGNHPPGE